MSFEDRFRHCIQRGLRRLPVYAIKNSARCNLSSFIHIIRLHNPRLHGVIIHIFHAYFITSSSLLRALTAHNTPWCVCPRRIVYILRNTFTLPRSLSNSPACSVRQWQIAGTRMPVVRPSFCWECTRLICAKSVLSTPYNIGRIQDSFIFAERQHRLRLPKSHLGKVWANPSLVASSELLRHHASYSV